MNNLQGIISKSIYNTNTQFDALGYLTTDASNVNTLGFKAIRFENYLKENGRLEGAVRRNYSTGVFMETKQPLDLSINGPGFFPVTTKNGDVSYTRDGSFKVNSKGYLVTNDDCIVGDGIKIPQNYYKLKIAKDGTVSIIPERDQDAQILGKIPIVNFNNPEGLKSIEGNKVAETADSGKATLIKDPTTIQQGSLEKSNVNMFSTVQDLLSLNASIIAGTRIVKLVDDLYRQSINLKQ